uniref:Uncharacterized protein n=1 Tax=Alexandrium catenella TaxID=2925 RepID=A0A7S1RDR8_ALECA
MAHFASRVLCVAATLSVACALRIDGQGNQEEPDLDHEEVKTGPATAVCIVGNAGTLPFSSMHNSLHGFVSHLNGTGLLKQSVDFYSYVTLQGLEKNREGYGYLAQNASYEQALYGVMTVGPIAYKIEQDHYEVTENNVNLYVNNRESCFTNGIWADSPKAMRKSLNQLAQWQHCLKMVFHQERIVGKKYEVVVLARPDIVYRKDTELNLNLVASEGHVLRQRDWVMVLPRRVAAGLMDKKKTKPLTCSQGEACCGKVGSSETLLEYLTGIGATNFDACNCGPKVEETGPIEQTTNLYIGRVINSGSLRGGDDVMLSVPFETVMTEHDGSELI